MELHGTGGDHHNQHVLIYLVIKDAIYMYAHNSKKNIFEMIRIYYCKNTTKDRIRNLTCATLNSFCLQIQELKYSGGSTAGDGDIRPFPPSDEKKRDRKIYASRTRKYYFFLADEIH